MLSRAFRYLKMGDKATKVPEKSVSERGRGSICPYRGLVLMQHLVVSAERHTENDGCDVLETVDPFLPLRPLTSHIKQPDGQRDGHG